VTATQAHAVPIRTYLVVFAGLLVLTLATVLVTGAPLGGWHTPAALFIAFVKATLIYLFFMHALRAGWLVWLTVLAALLWLALMLSLTWADYGSRRLDGELRDLPRRQAGPAGGRVIPNRLGCSRVAGFGKGRLGWSLPFPNGTPNPQADAVLAGNKGAHY
jgi:cytochrome c oxidase subunit 4